MKIKIREFGRTWKNATMLMIHLVASEIKKNWSLLAECSAAPVMETIRRSQNKPDAMTTNAAKEINFRLNVAKAQIG